MAHYVGFKGQKWTIILISNQFNLNKFDLYKTMYIDTKQLLTIYIDTKQLHEHVNSSYDVYIPNEQTCGEGGKEKLAERTRERNTQRN